MGYRFSLEQANWLAHLLQATGTTTKVGDPSAAGDALAYFLEGISENYYGNPARRQELATRCREAEGELRRGRVPHAILKKLSSFFADTPWFALLLPSGPSGNVNHLLMSRELLQELVSIRPDDPGLILQLNDVPEDGLIDLEDVFPAFNVALANLTRWPGVLLWTSSGEAAFFELPALPQQVRERLHWILSRLAVVKGQPNLELLKKEYAREHPPTLVHGRAPLRIIHLSDIHAGSKEAQLRMPRVQTIIRNLVSDLGPNPPVLPVVTGDLMNSPTDANLDSARLFMEFLNNLGTREPIAVLGNHDVRKDGWLQADHERALYIPQERVRWVDECSVGLVCLNSVRGGNWARGKIGERELQEAGNTLDRERERSETYQLLAVVHHHPIPVQKPTWYKSSWYERLLGRNFEKTEELQDADLFLQWAKARRTVAVLHGHKHIPRVDFHDGLPIIGCGSTVGKIETKVRGMTFMSMNLVTIDPGSGQISCRQKTEQLAGAGPEETGHHELAFKRRLRVP
jgi:predicted MPP superfamily phosphohydrolase